jgi:hypothetical protein
VSQHRFKFRILLQIGPLSYFHVCRLFGQVLSRRHIDVLGGLRTKSRRWSLGPDCGKGQHLLPLRQSRGISLVISASVVAAIRFDGSGSLFPAILTYLFILDYYQTTKASCENAYQEGTSPARPSILREEIRRATSARNASPARAHAAPRLPSTAREYRTSTR